MSELLSFSDGLHLEPRRGKELLGPAGLVRPDRPAAGEAEPETIPGRASSSATPRGFHLALLGPGVAPARGFHLISAIRGAPALNRVPSLRGASWQHRTDPPYRAAPTIPPSLGLRRPSPATWVLPSGLYRKNVTAQASGFSDPYWARRLHPGSAVRHADRLARPSTRQWKSQEQAC